ncbi:hypothetical protein SAMN04487969_101556 [Paenibacillus algorifonticola]|uniref:Uncharacterized protein n=1 Tax=Paenibacillus algorifonticola TaxID=684063 RepID=A0A1I1YHE8_9BACL|nr:hypothetical protein SAMN04487969_101556 [Paenibacillus algorifonticola]
MHCNRLSWKVLGRRLLITIEKANDKEHFSIDCKGKIEREKHTHVIFFGESGIFSVF